MVENKNKDSLSELKSFLHEHGASFGSLSAEQSGIEALYDTLWERRNDDYFWSLLRNLMARLDESRLSFDRVRQNELLPAATVDSLLSDLRCHLSVENNKRPPWKRFLSTVGFAGLLGFFALGAAVSCADTCEEEAEADGIVNPENFCDLVNIIDSADLPWNVRANLFDCLPNLDSYYRAYLLDRFLTASDDELASLLEELSTSGSCDKDEWEPGLGDDSGH